MILPNRLTSEEADFILVKDGSRSWWFFLNQSNDPQVEDGVMIYINYLPENSPHMEVGNFLEEGVNGALIRLCEILQEGWMFDDHSLTIQQFGDDHDIYGISQIAYGVCREHPCKGCPDENIDDGRCVNESACVAWQAYERKEG